MDRKLNRKLGRGAGCALTMVSALAFGQGCLSRQIVSNPPELQTNVAYTQENTQIDKVDILFDIDNSSSMGDKQEFLEAAIPDLIGRLVEPNCIPTGGGTPYKSTASPTNQPSCNGSDQLEFPAVHNLHVAVLSSSLGTRGGDVCTPGTGNYSARADDQGHLLGNGTGGTGADAWPASVGATETSSNFLAWFPKWPTNPSSSPDTPSITDPTTLLTDFTDVINAIGVDGCGIESQLESWYRFLIQPDPYATINVSNGVASWSDAVDTTILNQRAAFLRPDSLVAIIVLTDENDSEIDARSYGGTGFNFMNSDFQGDCAAGDFCPSSAPSICKTNPTSPSCTYNPSGAPITALNDWGYDINLRHVHMWQKYGLDPQYPIYRYVTGLTSSMVPDRSQEYPTNSKGQTSGQYIGTTLNCTNPLYAASLVTPPAGATVTYSANAKTLCNQKVGSRTSDMIFYAIIGGVPYQDLHYPAATNGTVDWSSYSLSPQDWQWIVGKNPEAPDYDWTGIDPHMIEDFQDRHSPFFPVTIGTPPAASQATGAIATLGAETATQGSAGWDPINGREWSTNDMGADGTPLHAKNGLNVDREYACIFKLPTPHNCLDPVQAKKGCDCQVDAGVLTHAQLPAVCDEANVNQQDYAKAYPTPRELLVARDLAAVPGANAGIVSSICPQDVVDNAAGTDPYYGYRPAMGAIVQKLKEHLQTTCIPPLQADPATGQVPCLLLAVLATPGPESSCASTPGLAEPDQAILTKFLSDNNLPPTSLVCEVNQTPVAAGQPSCTVATSNPGWCYYQPAADAGAVCAQEIDISASLTSNVLQNAHISYQCIQTSITDAGTD